MFVLATIQIVCTIPEVPQTWDRLLAGSCLPPIATAKSIEMEVTLKQS